MLEYQKDAESNSIFAINWSGLKSLTALGTSAHKIYIHKDSWHLRMADSIPPLKPNIFSFGG
jgi:hypothetical protein